MLYVLGSFILAAAGVLLKGLLNLSLSDVFVVLAIPMMLVFKVLGNRPAFFVYVAMLAGFAGGISFLYGYVIIPIRYYYGIWGWGGVVGGVLASLLLPFQLIIFLSVAYFKGGAVVYIGDFFAGILFGFAGLLLYLSPFTGSIWARLFHKGRNQ